MPQLKVRCPDCAALLALAPSAAGKNVRCPKCRTVFPIPANSADPGPAKESAAGAPARKRRFKPKKPGAARGSAVAILVVVLLLGGAAAGGIMLWKHRSGGAVVKDVVPPAGRGTNVGQLVAEIVAEDIDGKTFKLSDYRGKVVLLDFWGHW